MRTTPLACIIILPLVFLTACVDLKPTVDPTRFYVLGDVDGAVPVDEFSTSLHVARPDIPGYLDYSKISVRSAGGRLVMVPHVRWGEPVDIGIARVVAETVASELGNARVTHYPWPDSGREITRIVLDVHRFSGLDDGRVVVEITWARVEQGEIVMTGHYVSADKTWDKGEPASLVGALSDCLKELSVKIAAAFKAPERKV